MQRTMPIFLMLLLLSAKDCFSATKTPMHKLATHLLCAAAGTAAAISARPDALYSKIDQTIRRLNGKKIDGVTTAALDSSVTRSKYVELEKKFNLKFAPLTLDKSARVSIALSTYLLTLQVLSFLS